ncbi:MAG TPA: hypothetical protein PKE31_14615 [Pseudomonadota bacterium]|nr:hypothetical protein [Pseudomonadota bacterium]
MPAPQASVMQNLAKAKFISFATKLPTNWKQPQGEAGKQYVRAFKTTELVGIPPAPPMFVPATINKYHTDTAKKIGDQFATYIDGICSAICSAWSQWQSIATLTGVMVNAVTASVGQVVGPPWMPFIMASAPKGTPSEIKYSNAIANAISTGWVTYQATIKVPGLPWYPAFAAFPGPMAPPTPNIPCPVIMLTQVTASVSASMLSSMMMANLGDPTALHAKQLFDSVADAFDQCFKLWQTTTQVTNVLGMGPIPTFAPPFVPVGPVVGGVGNMTPGGFV